MQRISPMAAMETVYDDALKETIQKVKIVPVIGAPDKPCGVGRADANPKLLLNDT